MGTSGTVNNMFLSGLLGGVGNQMMTHEERQYQQKLLELKLKREVLASLASDKTASPQAQALALQGLLSSPEQPKAKGIRGALGQRTGTSPLDDILSQIKAMPAQTQPAKPPIQVPSIPPAGPNVMGNTIIPQTSAATRVPANMQPGTVMSEAPPIQIPGMPGSPPLTPPKLGMMGAPPQLPQQLPGMPEIPGLKADPAQLALTDPVLARLRLQQQLGREDVQADIKMAVDSGMSQEDAVKMVIGRMSPASRVAQSKDIVPGEAIGMEKGTWWRAELDAQGNILRYLPAGNPAKSGSASIPKLFIETGLAAGKSGQQILKDWIKYQDDIAAGKPVPGQVIQVRNEKTGQTEDAWIPPNQRKSNAPPSPKPMQGPGGAPLAPKLGQAQQARLNTADTIQKQGDRAIAFIQAHRDIFGPKAGRWNNVEQMIGSQDPAVAAAGSMLKSFALFQPSVHLARGKAMSDEFIGDVAQFKTNPDALIAKIREYQAAARNVREAILQGRDPDAVADMPHSVGEKRTFPNGAVGEWDGHGWAQVK